MDICQSVIILPIRGLLAVDSLFDLAKGHAVLLGDIGGVAHALRRRDTDLEASLAVVHACDQTLRKAVALDRSIDLTYGACQLVHMGVEDRASAQIAHGFDDILCDEHALGDAGGGKALVEQEQTAAGGYLKDTRQSLALLA